MDRQPEPIPQLGGAPAWSAWWWLGQHRTPDAATVEAVGDRVGQDRGGATGTAAAVADALHVLRGRPALRAETFVCLVSSSGLKWLDDYGAAFAEGATRLPIAAAARRAIEGWAG